ncbi:hypothetical protein DM01DRAFT_1333749 [Hesseltinella vesiculosa]|uniref:Proline-rich protein PRCC n=1 Tax=Hesseltinella vesiculosa TaxID=101127 RepID=A0A1X2GNT4_9FUNG|nr:hypothetical protein DM01DRAFT_1333749 [Hesseltinella vesiculosa]
MSLVANYDSSGSDSEDDQPQRTSTLSQLLPPPKSQKQERPIQQKKAVFYVPVDQHNLEDDEEDDQPKKRLKVANKGASLTDLLPAPKNSLFKKPTPSSSAKAVAHAVHGSALAKPSPQPTLPALPVSTAAQDMIEKEAEEEDDDDDDEEEHISTSHAGSFFKLGHQLKGKARETSKAKPSQPTRPTTLEKTQQTAEQVELDDPNAIYAYGADPNAYAAYYQYYEQQSDGASHNETLDSDVLSQLGGKRRGEDAGVKIVDLNQTDMLPSEDWRRRAMESQPKLPADLMGPSMEANALQKKKNNIMALAAQARNMQQTLEDQYAQQRIVKNEARRRYGF